MPEYFDLTPYFEINGIRAGISLKPFPYLPPQDRPQMTLRLGLTPGYLVLPEQCHSTQVLICEKPGRVPGTDGIITSRTDLVLSIQVADCIPMFIVDPVKQITGLVHAGWRGIVAGITYNAIETMVKLSSQPQSFKILLGPSIRQCCFEVGSEIADQFVPDYIRTNENSRSYVDLQAIVIKQLIELGVVVENIIDLEQCTHCHSDLYHSYRRDGQFAGRMAAVIGWL